MNVLAFLVGREFAIREGVSDDEAARLGLVGGIAGFPMGIVIADVIARREAEEAVVSVRAVAERAAEPRAHDGALGALTRHLDQEARKLAQALVADRRRQSEHERNEAVKKVEEVLNHAAEELEHERQEIEAHTKQAEPETTGADEAEEGAKQEAKRS
jgi:hypothetical protein